jgi:hypothetical protein
MSIIKIAEEGQSHTMTVTECEAVQGQYGEQVKFSDGADTIYLPKDSADRQLGRLTLDYETVVGATITFSRDHNPKKGAKPFWGISWAAPMTAPPKRIPPPSGAPPQGVNRGSLPFDEEPYSPAAQRLAPNPKNVGLSAPLDAPLVGDEEYAALRAEEPAQTPREAAIRERQRAFLDTYLGIYAGMLAGMSAAHKASNVTLTAEAVQAATATCVIQLERAGLVGLK